MSGRDSGLCLCVSGQTTKPPAVPPRVQPKEVSRFACLANWQTCCLVVMPLTYKITVSTPLSA